MDIVVRGKNCDVTADVKQLTAEKLSKLTRLAADIGRIEVDYSEIRNLRAPQRQLCEVTVHLKRHFVKAHAASTEKVAALDLVIDKVEHQVGRLKDKRVHRSHARRLVRHATDQRDGGSAGGSYPRKQARSERHYRSPAFDGATRPFA